MGLITSALQIGRSALLAYQSALQVVGNNISNAGSTSYTRQTPVLTPAGGVTLPEGFTPGGGVMLSSLKRNVDNALENRIRYALGDQSDALAQQQTLGRIESVLNELSNVDLSTYLQEFFNAFGGLQNRAHDAGARGLVITAADSLVREVGRQRADALALRDELNSQIEATARDAEKLTRDIAELNAQIVHLEASSPGSANSLRDQRDELLRNLSELVQIEVREQAGGSVNVYVGSGPLIQDGINRGIISTLEVTGGDPKVVVRFADDRAPLELKGGKLAGLVAARDTHAMGYLNSLNDFSATLIREVNKVHAQGQGLEGMTTAAGTYDVLDPAAALTTAGAGLALTPRNGSFQVNIRDQAGGTTQSVTILVDLDGLGADDSLNSLAAKITAQAGYLTATVTADNRLQLQAASGYEFTFGQDSSDVLAALGVNTFFAGSDAGSIAVNDALRGNLNLMAAATGPAEGDGTNAGTLAALATRALDSLNGRSLTEYYNHMASSVAVSSAAARSGVEAADAIGASLNAQRESISGVSLDEETIAMLRLERAFQGAARYSSTVDRMIQETLALVR